ncbi:MAG: hypothetical protein IJ124_15395 [Clostridia bacterium]|nr:hypothetical protein [Clostridia bacterium]
MDDAPRRALTAGSSRGIDDALAALAELGFCVAGRARDGASALDMVRALEPWLVVCDAVLPVVDGVAFAGRARRLKLNAQPRILLIKPCALRLPGEDGLFALGARAIEPPLTAERLERAVQALKCPLPPEKSLRLKALMDALGLPRHPGRACLASAAAMVWADRALLRSLRAGLYPRIAAQAGLSAAQVERAIQHVIDAAWRTGEIERQHIIFGDTIDARRGKPTCGEMIARLAEELRWEGRR